MRLRRRTGSTAPNLSELYAGDRQLTDIGSEFAGGRELVAPERFTAVSKDGTEVRMFVLSPTAEPDAPRPTILYGYGGFGVPLPPGYSAAILACVEAGGVWAPVSRRAVGSALRLGCTFVCARASQAQSMLPTTSGDFESS